MFEMMTAVFEMRSYGVRLWPPLGSYGTTGLAGDERLSVRIMRAPSHTPTTEPGVGMIVTPVLVAQDFAGNS